MDFLDKVLSFSWWRLVPELWVDKIHDYCWGDDSDEQ